MAKIEAFQNTRGANGSINLWQGLYALFVGEDDNWEAWLGVDGSGVISRMFSAGHPTTRLRRGFKDEGAPQGQEEVKQRKEEMEDDRKAQVSGGRIHHRVETACL